MKISSFAWAVLLMFVASCGGSDVTDGASCDSTDTFDWDSVTYSETQSTTSPEACDPQIQTYSYADLASSGNPGLNVLLHYEIASSGTSFKSFVSMNIYNQALGPYTFDGGTSTGSAGFIWSSTASGSSETCVATAGTVTLTTVDAVGGKVAGSYNATTLTGSGCPVASYSGSFSTDRKAEP